jgi:hypothetical protein
MLILDCCFGYMDTVTQRVMLFGTCFKPILDVPPGNHERMSVGDRKPVPDHENVIIGENDSILLGITEGAVRFSHGLPLVFVRG